MKDWAIARLQEQGTWRGLIMLIGALVGYQLDDGVSDALTALCVSVAASGLHNIVTKG